MTFLWTVLVCFPKDYFVREKTGIVTTASKYETVFLLWCLAETHSGISFQSATSWPPSSHCCTKFSKRLTGIINQAPFWTESKERLIRQKTKQIPQISKELRFQRPPFLFNYRAGISFCALLPSCFFLRFFNNTTSEDGFPRLCGGVKNVFGGRVAKLRHHRHRSIKEVYFVIYHYYCVNVDDVLSNE